MRALVLMTLLAAAQVQTPRDVIADLLALPAPPPGQYGDLVANVERAAKRPADDAPLEDLVAWWSMNRYNERATPSARVQERLAGAIEKQPESVDELLEYFPKREDVCHRVRRLTTPSDKTKTWLLHHCLAEREALAQKAAAARDDASHVANDEELLALARADWKRAEPLVRQFAGSAEARLRALALAILYVHEASETNRAALRAVAVDRTAPAKARDLAFEALTASEWEGRDAWVLSILGDPTLLDLRDGYSGFSPIERLVALEPDKWIPVMTQLLASADRTTRSLAANALAQFHLRKARADALRPVLRWISDPSFAEDQSMHRLRIIQSVAARGLVDAIPHLMDALAHDPDEARRAYAAQALAEFHEARANPLMREAAESMTSGYNRVIIVAALIANGGCSAEELASAVEAFVVRRALLPPNEAEMLSYGMTLEPVPIMLGAHVVQKINDRDDVASRLIARAAELQREKPEIARALREIVESWPVPSSDALILRQIEEGSAEAKTIASGLNRRESFRTTTSEALRRLSTVRGTRAGLAAVFLGDARRATQILAGDDAEAQRAFLAASRLVREPFPIQSVAALYGRTTPLDVAVDAWLIAEDSAEARALVQNRHRDEILIIGGGGGFEEWEKKILREFVRSKNDEVIALAAGGFMAPASVLEIRIRGNEATLVSEKRRWTLAPSILGELRLFLTSLGADDLGPLETGTQDGTDYEYLHLTRTSGRRVVMNSPYNASGSPHAELVRRLLALVE